MERYEISGYTTAKKLAQQLRHSAIVALLAKSFAEEENADMLLNPTARSRMRMPDANDRHLNNKGALDRAALLTPSNDCANGHLPWPAR